MYFKIDAIMACNDAIKIFYDLDMKNAQQLQKTLAISIVAFHEFCKKKK